MERRLDKQIESAVLALEPQWAAKGLKIECKCKKICASVDEELLTQAWINLIHNCVKFTPKGGRVKICLDEDAGFASVSISDTGIGISEADQIHVFERFYKADKSRDRSLGGNGLGLSLVKKIVELHGGTIKLESEEGKGTTFEVRLPIKSCARQAWRVSQNS
jgi:signal transduction histidine kinase